MRIVVLKDEIVGLCRCIRIYQIRANDYPTIDGVGFIAIIVDAVWCAAASPNIVVDIVKYDYRIRRPREGERGYIRDIKADGSTGQPGVVTPNRVVSRGATIKGEKTCRFVRRSILATTY
jgi:hypothetical protein